MKKVIKVGKGFGKHTLDDAILSAKKEDVIVVDPGHYTLEQCIRVNHLTIKGKGKFPSDVIIEGLFTVYDQSELTLENVTCQTVKNNNMINVKNESTLRCFSVVLKGLRQDPDYPLVFTANSRVFFEACELHTTSEKHTGLCLTEGSIAQVKQSILTRLACYSSKAVLETTQVKRQLYIESNSECSGGHLYLDQASSKIYQMLAKKGSIIHFNTLTIEEEKTYFVRCEESEIQIQHTNLRDQTKLIVDKKEQDTVTLPKANIRLLQQTTPPKKQESAQKNQTKKTTSEKTVKEKQNALEKLNQLIGLTNLKVSVKDFIDTARFNRKRMDQGLKARSFSLHAAFLGNPGTGKTTVARLVGQAMYEEGVLKTNRYVEASRQDLVSDNVGGTALKTQEVLEKALGGVLFIDEAYTLYQEGGTNWGQEAVDTILKFMEDHRDDIMIIFAGYTKEMNDFINMNPGLKSRVANFFTFEDYTAEEIAKIGILDLKNTDFNVNEALYTTVVKKEYESTVERSNGRWIRNFNDRLIRITARNQQKEQYPQFDQIKDRDIEELTGGSQKDKEKELDTLLQQLDEMIGLEKVKTFVHQLVQKVKVEKQYEEQLGSAFERQGYHMLFTGNPGTGKTTVARLVAKIFYNLNLLSSDTVLEVSRPDLVGRYIGETETKTSKLLRDALGGVLFVDEAYQLSQETSGNDFGKQAIETLLTALENDRDKFVAIFAGYTKEMEEFIATNPGLRSRVNLTLEFEDYTPEEVGKITGLIVSKHWKVNVEQLEKEVANAYRTLAPQEKANGRSARIFAEKIIDAHKLTLLKENITDAKEIKEQTIVYALKGKEASSKKESVEDILSELNQMIGLKEVKAFVTDLVAKVKVEQELQELLPQESKSNYHMLFTGNPGTGKTTVARLIARLFHALGILPNDTVLEVSRPDLIGRYIGETEEKTTKVLNHALGGVLFIDEAYQLSQETTQNDFGKQAIETLLTALENHRGEFIAIFAGYTKEMEEFVAVNPGLSSRIPLEIEFPSYTPEEVGEMASLIVRKNWHIDEAVLKNSVALIYRQLPEKDRSNGRFARNFAEKLINAHKVWLSTHLESEDKLNITTPLLMDVAKTYLKP